MYDICCAGMWVSWDMPTAVGITRQTAANIDGNMYAHHSNTTRSMQRKSVQIRDANDLSPKEPTQQRNQSDHPRLNQPSASLQRQGEDGRKMTSIPNEPGRKGNDMQETPASLSMHRPLSNVLRTQVHLWITSRAFPLAPCPCVCQWLCRHGGPCQRLPPRQRPW